MDCSRQRQSSNGDPPAAYGDLPGSHSAGAATPDCPDGLKGLAKDSTIAVLTPMRGRPNETDAR